MSFTLQLSQDVLSVEPGSTVPVSITVINRGSEIDRYELEVEGIDAEWKAVPVPVFTVEPGETHTEKVFFRPPRASESNAGNYPFVVHVRSLDSGDDRRVQGVINVKAFHHLTMEISPKKGYVSPFRKQNSFSLVLVNLSNTEHTVQLYGNDPEDACAFDFAHDQVTIGPGQQREVELTTNPTQTPLFSSGRLIGFSVTARSTDSPSVVASAQAQLEQRSLLSPTSLGVFLVLAVLFTLYLLNLPKPASISLVVDPLKVERGQPVKITWHAANASVITVKANDETIYQGSALDGERTWTVSSKEIAVFNATATGDSRPKEAPPVTVVVTEPPIIPDPEITTLRADKTRVKLGESFILTYAFNNAVVDATLGPTGEKLDPALSSREIKPSQTGDITYEVVAENSAGKTVKKKFSISVYDESSAVIISFDPSTQEVPPDGGNVTISWNVTNAVQVKLKQMPGPASQVVETEGSRDFVITQKTSFTLTAFDDKGRTTAKTITIKVMPRPIPTPDPSTPTDGGVPPSTPTTGGNPPGTNADGSTNGFSGGNP